MLQFSANRAEISSGDTPRGPTPSENCSLKQCKKYVPPGLSTLVRLLTKSVRSSSEKLCRSPQSVTVSKVLPSSCKARASPTRNVTLTPNASAFPCAFLIPAGEKSIPHTSICPCSTKYNVFSPVPHPTSSTDPRSSPAWSSST